MNSQTERKLQIFRIRISNLLEEHADALAQAQELHAKLQEAEEKIGELESKLRKANVQEKEPNHTIIDMDAVKN